MEIIQTFRKCISGPRLYFLCSNVEYSSESYQRNSIEKCCDIMFDSCSWIITIVTYLSPFIAYNAYKHGPEPYIAIAKETAIPALSIYTLALILRGVARTANPTYAEFVNLYYSAQTSPDKEMRHNFLKKYDFEFHHRSADFIASPNNSSSLETIRGYTVPFLLRPFYYIVATWLAKPLAYPGSTYPLNAILRSQLDASRLRYLEKDNVRRAKLRTVDGCEIDTMFFDNRGSDNDKGNTLVITSEGNGGYYEVGCFEIPQKAGYSSLGWNHPGFGHSTGIPFDTAEMNSIEAVYEYATTELGFSDHNIIVYGWSIGGFPTAYIAHAHPNISSAIVDASFDDIIPLALPRMPQWLAGITVRCCRHYFNLHNSLLLSKYPGPVRIIRRSRDEIISTNERPDGNRGNELLGALLLQRYPTIFGDEEVQKYVRSWYAETGTITRRLSVPGELDRKFCATTVGSLPDRQESYPELGTGLSSQEKIQLAYYLFDKYLTDLDVGHNSPLPPKHFEVPWKHSDSAPKN
eukprot:sb/3463870/